VRFSVSGWASFFAGILLISLAGKVAVNQPVAPVDKDNVAARLSAMLNAAGMEVVNYSDYSDGIAVSGERGSCRIWAMEYSSYGTMADVIARRAKSVGELRYVYRGEISDSAPRLQPLLDFYWWRERKRIGMNVPRGVPWRDIAVLYE
jgi:hypothetical protein